MPRINASNPSQKIPRDADIPPRDRREPALRILRHRTDSAPSTSDFVRSNTRFTPWLREAAILCTAAIVGNHPAPRHAGAHFSHAAADVPDLQNAAGHCRIGAEVK